MTPTSASTLVELLRQRALDQPDRVGYLFLRDGDEAEAPLTYGELDRRARAIAARLQGLRARGERAVLLYPTGLEYISAVFGCLYAGVVSVPAHPPRGSRSLPRLEAIVADARASLALTTTALQGDVRRRLPQAASLEAVRWLATDALGDDLAADWQEPGVGGDTLAFLQYTSGSTTSPRGVLVTHANLLHNERMISRAFETSECSIVVGWLPLYHDMGLMGNVLQPLYAGALCVLMSPLAFLEEPARWLRAISRFRGTTSGGPNFAYDLCVRKVSPEQRATLDLSCWEVAFNGAEPVRAETLERFAATFGPCGFRREALYPSYGLAEGTLFVTGGAKAAPPVTISVDRAALAHGRVAPTASADASARTLVGCGRPSPEQRVVVVDPVSATPGRPGEVGEIWVAGPAVAGGYWGRPAESERIFRARLAESDEGPFLRTGDLGVLHDGELFVTGRLKDLIIIRGRNVYPQDIELTVEQSHPAFRPGCAAAFPVDRDGEERLVVVQEVDRRYRDADPEELAKSARQAVAEQHEVAVYVVSLVRPGGVSKTTSGKVQRWACRERWLEGSLPELGRSIVDGDSDAAPARGEPDRSRPSVPGLPLVGAVPGTLVEAGWNRRRLEADLLERVGTLLGVRPERLDPRQPLTALGLDSLLATELRHGVEAALGIALPQRWLLEGCSVSAVVERVLAGLPEAGPPLRARSGPLPEPVREAPPSAGQRALWFLHQLAPESSAYNLASAARLRGNLDLTALRRAFEALVERHAALRTTFPARAGEPLQQIHAAAEACLDSEDATTHSEAAFLDHLAELVSRPFDLERGPLVRLCVRSRSTQEHVLLLSAHHLVADFWSFGLLVRDLAALYTAATGGARPSLAPPALEYADYVRWQAEVLTGAEGERLWAYWLRQLAGPLPALDLPTDRPRPPIQSYRGAAHAFRLGARLSRRLAALARAEGATLYATLLAAFQVLLHRYSHQEVVLVGSPTSGRERAAFADLVGYVANPVVLRADLAGDPAFRAFLGQVRATVLAALDHQLLPFPVLVERLRMQRDASRSPVFQAMFVWQRGLRREDQALAAFALNLPGARLDLAGLELESVGLEPRGAQVDLTLAMAEIAGELAASLQYNSDLFDAATIGRLAGHFRTLLKGIVDEPDRPISALPLLTRAEHRRIAAWNRTEVDYPADRCLHELVEVQVERSPNAVALAFEGARLTYRELNRRANRVAHHLRALGVGAETLVGICLERGLDLPIGLLGILKAGAAYLPLDPADPPDRLAFMLEDARAPVLLTHARLAPRLPRRPGGVVCLDAEPEGLARASADNPASGVAPEHLAYVIYTSGSTGRPKGVMIPHRGICNRLLWMQRAYRLGAGDRVLQKTPSSFDVSVWEVFWPLLAGAGLTLARPGGHRDPAYLARLIAEQRITTVHFVPSMLRVFLEAPGLEACTSLRRVICSGETLPGELVERFRARLAAELHNLYGPTEASVDVTAWDCRRDPTGHGVPIGRPIANVRIELLDAAGQRVPVGVPGELHIGGVGLARGYLNRPALTAERFIPDPYSEAPGARLYRTGDLARYRPDGAIEFLGRLDDQVKLRGLRIEPGEIEAVLAQHPAVREAVVLVQPGPSGDQVLQAAVVGAAESPPTTDGLRRFLRRRLPDYMVPATFAFLERPPLTPSGKLDRRALARLAIPSAAPAVDEPPATELERTLACLWQELLRLERVDRHANFFQLGGHSLLLAQLQVRLRERLGIHLSLSQLFEAPTLALLAERVAAEPERRRSALPELVRQDPPATQCELSYAQQPIFVLSRLKAEGGFFHMPVGISWRAELPPAVVESALRTIVRRHAALRTVFAVRDGLPIQLVRPEPDFAFGSSVLDPLPRAEAWARVEAHLREDRRRTFDLERGPLVRAHLFRLSPIEQVVYLNVHHLVADGWSLGVIAREFTRLCDALLRGERLELPRPAVEYADYVRWERERIRSGALATQERYWLEQTKPPVPEARLPVDHDGRPGSDLFRGEVVSTTFSAELATALREAARAQGVTLYTALLAAHVILLHRLTGSDEVVVGMPVSVRARSALYDVVGCFVNVLPIRVELLEDDTVGAVRRRVHQRVVAGLEHQDYPLSLLLEKHRGARRDAFRPLFSTVFLLQNFPTADLSIAGASGRLLELEPDSNSKADLLWTLAEQGDRLRCDLRYDTRLFEPATARRLLRQFERALQAVGRDPEQSIYRPSLNPGEA